MGCCAKPMRCACACACASGSCVCCLCCWRSSSSAGACGRPGNHARALVTDMRVDARAVRAANPCASHHPQTRPGCPHTGCGSTHMRRDAFFTTVSITRWMAWLFVLLSFFLSCCCWRVGRPHCTECLLYLLYCTVQYRFRTKKSPRQRKHAPCRVDDDLAAPCFFLHALSWSETPTGEARAMAGPTRPISIVRLAVNGEHPR